MFARILPKVGCDSFVCGYSTLIDFGVSEPTHLTSQFDITRRRRASGVGVLCVSPLGPRVAARRRAGRWRWRPLKPGSHQRFASVRRAERERGAYENKGAGGQNRSRRSRSAHNPRSFRRSQCEPVKNTPTAAAEERVSNGGDTFRSKMDLFYLLALNVERW